MNKYLILSSLLIITACESGQVQENLGISRNAPNEFAVVSRPPLSLPPEFNLLPPDPDAININEISADKKAESILLGAKTPGEYLDSQKSPIIEGSEGSFLGKLGGTQANPDIRKLIRKDKNLPEDNGNKFSPAVKWLGFGEQRPGKVINPKEEAQRIRKNIDTSNLNKATVKETNRINDINSTVSKSQNDNHFLNKLIK